MDQHHKQHLKIKTAAWQMTRSPFTPLSRTPIVQPCSCSHWTLKKMSLPPLRAVKTINYRYKTSLLKKTTVPILNPGTMTKKTAVKTITDQVESMTLDGIHQQNLSESVVVMFESQAASNGNRFCD